MPSSVRWQICVLPDSKNKPLHDQMDARRLTKPGLLNRTNVFQCRGRPISTNRGLLWICATIQNLSIPLLYQTDNKPFYTFTCKSAAGTEICSIQLLAFFIKDSCPILCLFAFFWVINLKRTYSQLSQRIITTTSDLKT